MAIIVRDLLNKNHYLTSICSQTFLVAFVMIIATIILPYILVTLSRNYWINTEIFVEQPTIKHMNEIMVYVYTTSAVYSFGSTSELNQIFEGTSQSGSVLSPSFEILNHDLNEDRKVDQIEVKITMHAKPRELRNIVIMQTFVN
jgi:hypothetical protein